VLEREIIAWLLDPDGGHDPGGRTLAHYGQDYLEDFFETLARLELPRPLVTGIAQVGLRDLTDAPPDWSSLREAGLLGPRLWFVARHAPGATARVLRRRIDASTLDELHARVDIRRGLMFALEELGTREDAFEDAEAALFRLAQAENEAYANNATSTWAGLFFVELNATHRSLAQRLHLLERHALDPDPGVRAIAIKDIQAASRALKRQRVKGSWMPRALWSWVAAANGSLRCLRRRFHPLSACSSTGKRWSTQPSAGMGQGRPIPLVRDVLWE
jgi:hypothetical protein